MRTSPVSLNRLVNNLSLTANDGGEAISINNFNNKHNEKSKVWVAVESAQSDDEKNMSDGELAGLIGVRRQTVNNWINGRRDVTVGQLHEVASALGVRVRDLFDE